MKQETEIKQKLKELQEIRKSFMDKDFEKDENEDFVFIEGKINILNWILENK